MKPSTAVFKGMVPDGPVTKNEITYDIAQRKILIFYTANSLASV